MCALDRLHVEVENAIFGADGSVARVGKRAGLAIAETGDIVLIAAEVLTLGGPKKQEKLAELKP